MLILQGKLNNDSHGCKILSSYMLLISGIRKWTVFPCLSFSKFRLKQYIHVEILATCKRSPCFWSLQRFCDYSQQLFFNRIKMTCFDVTSIHGWYLFLPTRKYKTQINTRLINAPRDAWIKLVEYRCTCLCFNI